MEPIEAEMKLPRQPEPVRIEVFGNDQEDIRYWLRDLARRATFKGDIVEVQDNSFTIYPRTVND